MISPITTHVHTNLTYFPVAETDHHRIRVPVTRSQFHQSPVHLVPHRDYKNNKHTLQFKILTSTSFSRPTRSGNIGLPSRYRTQSPAHSQVGPLPTLICPDLALPNCVDELVLPGIVSIKPFNKTIWKYLQNPVWIIQVSLIVRIKLLCHLADSLFTGVNINNSMSVLVVPSNLCPIIWAHILLSCTLRNYLHLLGILWLVHLLAFELGTFASWVLQLVLVQFRLLVLLLTYACSWTRIQSNHWLVSSH